MAPDGAWSYWLLLAGRGFGKTRVGAEWVREQVKTHERVGLIGKDAADMRSVMIEGESGIMAVCPPWERPVWKASQRELRWPNGAISECRTGEDPEGVRGIQYHRLWVDELAAWQYPKETWDEAVLGLRLPPDPRAVITTTPKPIRLLKNLLSHPHSVVTRGTTYTNLSNLAKPFADQIIREYEGTRRGRQELLAEMLLDEGLAYPDFSEQLHSVPAFDLPAHWTRFESMDYGLNAPTAWLLFASDTEGNLIVADSYYVAGELPEDHAPRILARRSEWWEQRDEKNWPVRHNCYGDPMSLRERLPVKSDFGEPYTLQEVFQNLGIHIIPANNRRQIGYTEISSRLRPDTERVFPSWHPRYGEKGAPRLYLVGERCPELIEQLRDAPLVPPDKKLAGEAIDEEWESAHGHAHAALRYGVTTRARASEEPKEEPDDSRVAHMLQLQEAMNVGRDTEIEDPETRTLTPL